MKRLLNDKEKGPLPLKKPRIVPEYEFFNNLTYYEQKRWLFALIGLSVNIDIDVIRVILIDFMYVSCSVEDDEGEPVPPLTYRYYYKYDGVRLFKEMREILYTQIKNTIEKDVKKLDKLGVKKERRYIIIANANPYDGLGKLIKYTENWFDEEVKPAYKEWIDMPPISFYACVDIMDNATIRTYLYDSSCLSHGDLINLQNRIRRYF